MERQTLRQTPNVVTADVRRHVKLGVLLGNLARMSYAPLRSPTTEAPLNAVSIPRKEHAMSKVVAIMSMSLDGYVADLNDGVAEVFDWYFTSGDVEFHTGGSDPMTFKVSGPSAEHLRGLWSELGAVLTGRRTFDVAHGWDGNHAWGPAFVLTHHIPAGWRRPNSTVHFVTDGIESAVNQIHVDIAAVLLGSGVRLFDRLAGTPVVLGNPTMIQG